MMSFIRLVYTFIKRQTIIHVFGLCVSIRRLKMILSVLNFIFLIDLDAGDSLFASFVELFRFL